MSVASSKSPLVERAIRGGDVVGEAHVIDALEQLVTEQLSLYAWAAGQSQPRALRGRAPVYVVPLPGTHETIVVRHGWHGGLFAPITGDRFRRPTRAPHEYRMSQTLRAWGVPTTAILGFARYSAPLGLCRVDVVSRFEPEAFDLGHVAANLVPGIAIADALEAARRLLVSLAAHRVVHPDLNVKNILLQRDRAGALRALVIDVDVVRIESSSDEARVMARNVRRLMRSLHKWRDRVADTLTDDELSAFEHAALRDVPTRTSGAQRP